MAGFKVIILIVLFGQLNADFIKLGARITLDESDECKVRSDYTKHIEIGGTAAKADLAGSKQDKALQFTKTENWPHRRAATGGTTDKSIWKFEIGMNTDAFICFPEFYTPRSASDVPDSIDCVTANEDYLELKDDAGVLMECCGTQCHGKTFKIVQQAGDKTYTVTLKVQDKTKYAGFGATTFPDAVVLPTYYSSINKDVVRFQVSEQKTTAAEDKAADDKALGSTKYKPIKGCSAVGSLGNWKIYIYKKTTDDTEDKCKTACTGTDEASAKLCDFYIWKDSACYLGDFERSPAVAFLPAAGALVQPVDINYKEPPLADASMGYDDHKEECGMVGLFVKGTNLKDATIATEAECSALCALGCKTECQTYKYDPASKDCNYVNWAKADIAKTFSKIDLFEAPKKTKANNLKALADANVATISGTPVNKALCDAAKADGTAVIDADVTGIDYLDTTNSLCILVTHQAKAGKQTSLTLPVGFGGAGDASGGIFVYAGLISDNGQTGVEIYKNDLTKVLGSETTVTWSAPVATIVYKITTKANTKDDGVNIVFQK